jgi:hypothetical protein
MATTTFGKEQWVELFREIGLDEPTMQRWHASFEQRWPDAHGGFLEWLGIPQSEIERIREASRGPWVGR